MQPLISIVMPAYNVETYIPRSIESVLNQTYKEFELIIVDDGSPDRSGNIAEEYARRDAKICVIHQANGGLSDARNTGMKVARGKYILFVDSDDYIDESLLENVVHVAEKEAADVTIFGYFIDRISVGKKKLERQDICANYGIYKYEDLKNIQIDSKLLQMVGYAWNKLYNMQFLRKNKCTFTKGLSVVEDIVFNLSVLSKLNKLIILDKPLYHYIHRERKTLINMFHKNAFILHKKGIVSRKKIFEAWGINQNTINEFIALGHIIGIRYCCANMFYYKNELTPTERLNYIKLMLDDEFTQEIINNFRCKNTIDLIMKFTVKYKMNSMLFMLYMFNARKNRIGIKDK